MSTTQSFHVRLASVTDFQSVRELCIEFEKSLLSYDSNINANTSFSTAALDVRIQNEIFTVCQSLEDGLLGFVSIRTPTMPALGRLFPDPIGRAVITSVYVKECFRKQSIATMMLDFSLKHLLFINVREVTLAVRNGNTSALKLYKKFVFSFGTIWMSKHII